MSNIKYIIDKHKKSPQFYFDKKDTQVIAKNLSIIEKLDNDTVLSILLSLNHTSLCKFMTSSKTNEKKSLPALKKLILKLAENDQYNKGIIVNYLQENFIKDIFSRQIIDILFDNINNQLYSQIINSFGDTLSINQIKTYVNKLSGRQICEILKDIDED